MVIFVTDYERTADIVQRFIFLRPSKVSSVRSLVGVEEIYILNTCTNV